ncbi:MAG: (4Fe-4S)-binding protein, partial [Alphaproteobacteria bacterium]|nr:(4Fe-4S)-binding protein [Alphaproteobacteria bacterium]
MAKHLILCDCSGSQKIDADRIGQATGLRCSRVHSALCTSQIAAAGKAILAGDAVIACAQEATRFAELAEDLGAGLPLFVDLRDRAGWSDGTVATPKMAALVAAALIEAPATRTLDVASGGACLVIGRAGVALPAADRLADTLAVTVLLTEAGDLPLTRG